jgi:hypothetical protein
LKEISLKDLNLLKIVEGNNLSFHSKVLKQTRNEILFKIIVASVVFQIIILIIALWVPENKKRLVANYIQN